MKRISRDTLHIEIAKLMAKRSKCEKAKVGAIITMNNRIISSGYNGSINPDHVCVCVKGTPCEEAVHAEANAIFAAAREGISLLGSTLYTTYSPCLKCAQAIFQSGIVKVVYLIPYRDTTPLDMLKKKGIETIQYEEDTL